MNSPNTKSYDIILASVDVLCRIFWGPDPGQCKALLQGELLLLFESLAQGTQLELQENLNKLKSIINSYDGIDSLCEALNEEYVGLFISHREGIAAPLYESCYEYENAPLMGPSATRMKTLLETAGLTISNDLNEPPDHLSIELEYLYFLLNTAEEDEKSGTLSEASEFASEIMFPWIERFYKKLAAASPESLYTVSAHILCMLLNLIRNKALFNR